MSQNLRATENQSEYIPKHFIRDFCYLFFLLARSLTTQNGLCEPFWADACKTNWHGGLCRSERQGQLQKRYNCTHDVGKDRHTVPLHLRQVTCRCVILELLKIPVIRDFEAHQYLVWNLGVSVCTWFSCLPTGTFNAQYVLKHIGIVLDPPTPFSKLFSRK